MTTTPLTGQGKLQDQPQFKQRGSRFYILMRGVAKYVQPSAVAHEWLFLEKFINSPRYYLLVMGAGFPYHNLDFCSHFRPAHLGTNLPPSPSPSTFLVFCFVFVLKWGVFHQQLVRWLNKVKQVARTSQFIWGPAAEVLAVTPFLCVLVDIVPTPHLSIHVPDM